MPKNGDLLRTPGKTNSSKRQDGKPLLKRLWKAILGKVLMAKISSDCPELTVAGRSALWISPTPNKAKAVEPCDEGETGFAMENVMSRTHNLLSCILAFVWRHRSVPFELDSCAPVNANLLAWRACPGNRAGHVKILIVLVRRRQSSLGSCFCSMFGLEEGRSTRGLGSGKMSAPDHNNQFPCALLPIEFRCFAQCRGSKGRCYGNDAVRNRKRAWPFHFC